MTEQSYKPFDNIPEINEFTINNLTWSVDNDSIIISPSNKDIIYRYWAKRIKECK